MDAEEKADLVERMLHEFTPYEGSDIGRHAVFSLLCSVTKSYRKDKVQAKVSVNNPKQLRGICEKFIAQGWG